MDDQLKKGRVLPFKTNQRRLRAIVSRNENVSKQRNSQKLGARVQTTANGSDQKAHSSRSRGQPHMLHGGGGAFESEANLNRRRPGTGRRAWPPRRVGNRRGRPLAGQTPGDESPVGADLQGRSVGERQYGWSVGGQAGRSARLHGRPWRHPEDARRGAGARLLFVLGQRNTPPQAGNTPPFAMCFAGQLQLQPFNTA